MTTPRHAPRLAKCESENGKSGLIPGLLLAHLVGLRRSKTTNWYWPGITSQDRVIHNGEVYGVTSVANVHSSRRELQWMCRAIG